MKLHNHINVLADIPFLKARLVTIVINVGKSPVLSIRAGSRPKQPATGQSLAGYFRLTLLFNLVRNFK